MKFILVHNWLQQIDADVLALLEIVGMLLNMRDNYHSKLGRWEAVQWSLSYNHLEKHPTEVQLRALGC